MVVGVVTAGNFDGTLKALGVNASTGDQRAQVRIIVNYLNSHGGVGGHPIRPVYYDTDTAASQQVNGQAACAAFTEDNHAVAAIGVAGMDDTYHACADKRGLIALSDNDVKTSSFHRRYRTSILISEMALDRKYRAMVLALKDMGFFPPRAKVGLVYTDERNDAEGVRLGMKPALSSIGITPTDEVALSSADSGRYYSQMSSAILNFRAAGVTHVLFGFAAAWAFAEAADKQGYYPKMGIDSRQAPGLFMQTVNNPRSLANVFGVGYLPIADVDAERDPGPVTDRGRLCSKLFDDAGQGFGTNRLAASSALVLCDELFFLRDAFAGASDLSRAAFLRGVDGLGMRYQSTLTFATRFSSSQHDGPQAYRPLRYKAQCSCFDYVGPARPFR
jgi:hypothetical protein